LPPLTGFRSSSPGRFAELNAKLALQFNFESNLFASINCLLGKIGVADSAPDDDGWERLIVRAAVTMSPDHRQIFAARAALSNRSMVEDFAPQLLGDAQMHAA
jgi:hypothetical protein